MNSIKHVLFCTLVVMLSGSCSNDDDASSEPQMGYFVKEILMTEYDEEILITFQYDNQNRLIGQKLDHVLMEFGYNDLGQMTTYKEDGNLKYGFEYSNDLISKLIEYNTETGIPGDELSVSFSDGYYMVDQDTICKIGTQNQLLEIPEYNVVFSYGEDTGVHQHLMPIPARYFIDSEILLYDMSLSNDELKGWVLDTGSVWIENIRDDRGLITNINLIESSPGAPVYYTWEVTYEQRLLNP